jgi:hypothetical protein
MIDRRTGKEGAISKSKLAYAVAPSVGPCYNREWNQHMTVFARYVPFWRVKYETKSYLNWMVDVQVWTRS